MNILSGGYCERLFGDEAERGLCSYGLDLVAGLPQATDHTRRLVRRDAARYADQYLPTTLHTRSICYRKPFTEASPFRDGSITSPGTRRTEEQAEEKQNSGGWDHPRTEGTRAVASKAQSLRWLERIKESQRLTAREERRKAEILGVFHELYMISAQRLNPPEFPPWRSPW